MKTNFKKLAVQAGVAAAMAAGSMAASAQIESVPATAQLVPLFYYNDNGIDTNVRMIVPRSVGADTVIDLMDGGLNPSARWAVDSPALNGAMVHWFWMLVDNFQILDGTIQVSADDEAWLSAAEIDHRLGTGSLNGVPGYLIITNDTAAFGGAPTFQFAADAYLDNDQFAYPSLPAQLSVPVLPMNDAADATNASFITPGNQVIESGAWAANGPHASPLFSGIRTSATLAGANYRVVDVPMYTARGRYGAHHNVIVAWADQNNSASLDIPTLFAVDHDELTVSFPGVDLNNQLNFMVVPSSTQSWNDIGGLSGAIGISDDYAVLVNPANSRALADGFLKMVMPAPALPTGAGLEPGAYSSAVVFNIPVGANILNPSTNVPATAIDTGFFAIAQ